MFVPFRRSSLHALVFSVTLLVSLANARARELTYNQIQVDMRIEADTSIHVVETQDVALSGDWNGLYRDYDLRGCDGITVVGVMERDEAYANHGVARKGGYVVERGSGKLKVRWRSRDIGAPLYDDAATQFAVVYELTGAVAQYRNRDVFYWKPLFADRNEPFRKATVRLFFPERVNDAEVTFFSGTPGAEWEWADGRTLVFEANNVGPKDRFEIKVAIPKGIFEPYHSVTNTYFYHVKPWLLPGGAAGSLVGAVLLWWLFGRDPLTSPASLRSVDLDTIPPGLAGLLYDESFDDQDLTATILDLARRGYLSITETAEKKLLAKAEYEIRLERVPASAEVAVFERTLLQGLFGKKLTAGETTTSDALRNRFYKHIPEIRKQAWTHAGELGWFTVEPRRATKRYLIAGITVAAIGIAVAATERPELAFIAVWGSLFGGIPGSMLVGAVRRSGLMGLLTHIFLVPFTVIGLGVIGVFSYVAYGNGMAAGSTRPPPQLWSPAWPA